MRRTITRGLAIGLTGLAVLITMTGCNRNQNAKAAAPPPPPEVMVAPVEQRTVSIVRDFTARTEAVPTVEVRARVAGVLEDVLFKEGADVKKGQTLFIIQQAEYKAALETARAQLAKAQADLIRAKDASVVARFRATLEQRKADLGKAQQDVNRYKPLAEARAIPQQDLDSSVAAEKVAAAGVDAAVATLRDSELAQRTEIQLAEAAVEAAKASIIQADLNLGYTTVTSPINGIIGKVMVDRGNLVGKAEPTLLATVSSVNPIYADFSVSEGDYLKLAPRIRVDPQGRAQGPRQALELFLTDDRPFAHKGYPVFVDRAVDGKTGTIGIRAEFPNPEQLIRPGQFARVRGVIDQRPNAVLVSQLAVQEQQGAKIVLVVEPGDKVALRTVKIDERVGDNYIVTEGLKAGERVIVEGIQRVRPGMQVTAKASPAAAENPAAMPVDRPAEKAAEKPAGKKPATAPAGKPGA
jgi:membrane fusion protein (multidrug efflux system)